MAALRCDYPSPSMWIAWTTNNVLVSVLTILKNPMILMGLVSMGIFIGMPYLMENSTPNIPLPHLPFYQS